MSKRKNHDSGMVCISDDVPTPLPSRTSRNLGGLTSISDYTTPVQTVQSTSYWSSPQRKVVFKTSLLRLPLRPAPLLENRAPMTSSILEADPKEPGDGDDQNRPSKRHCVSSFIFGEKFQH
jgi:hypothetical protein